VFTVAYLANQFPSSVEPYVIDEIKELRGRGVRVVAGSVRTPDTRADQTGIIERNGETICLQNRVRGLDLLHAAWLCLIRWRKISDLVSRVLLRGRESPLRRVKALLHTWLGAYYAVFLTGRGVEHIHVHHGYFGSWIGMVAARLLGAGFSMTLHGSDLLMHGAYLDIKLKDCGFCLTVSDYNRRWILEHYSGIEPGKILVSRLGVELDSVEVDEHVRRSEPGPALGDGNPALVLLAVGRLHKVKDHAFLIRACVLLRDRCLDFRCLIAGGGPERRHLESLIRENGLERKIALLGHVSRNEMNSWYERADLVVLTSKSEGIPLVLMEAMARSKLVLAPAITGIPELVVAEKTGFLYKPGSVDDFVARIFSIQSLMSPRKGSSRRREILSAGSRLDWVRHAARTQVSHHFNRKKNLAQFGDLFLRLTAADARSLPHEDLVLQQIQLSIQRY